MKAQDERPNLPEMPPYRLGRHWNTIQAYLIPGIEDDIGELSEEMKKFMGICELLIDDKGIFRVCPHRFIMLQGAWNRTDMSPWMKRTCPF